MRTLLSIRFFLPLVVLILIASIQVVRIRRVQQLTALPEWSVDAPTPQPSSLTGYAHDRRSLIVPDPSGQSQQWIAQTQQLLAQGTWRIDHVDYDNAPYGRDTRLPSLYRAWLALISVMDRAITSLPSGLAVEQAALYADPLLQILLAVAAAWFIRRHFGSFAGIVVFVALLTVYPLATNFIPAAPNSQGLVEACAFWSVVPIAACLATVSQKAAKIKSPPMLFFLAGVAGGIGLGLNLNTQLSVLGGIVLGAAAVIYFGYRPEGAVSLPWRMWALGGCVAGLLGYLVEYFPSRMALRLDANHPLYALTWLAAGELLQRLSAWSHRKTRRPSWPDLIVSAVAVIGVIGTTYLWVRHRTAILSSDITISQLTRIGEGVRAPSLARWILSEGASLRMWTTVFPAILLLALCIPLVMRATAVARRATVAFALGPMITTLCFALSMPRWWNTFDSVALVALAVAVSDVAQSKSSNAIRWMTGTGVGAIACLGLLQLVPPATAFRKEDFTSAEMQKIMERDLAHWLSQRQPGAIVLAPAALTTSLWFYGGLRGITTLDADNNDGLGGALRIAAALTQHEASVLLQQRQVSYIVLPSWDFGLDQSARIATGGGKSLFIEQLRDWILPGWIRPVAYFAPAIDGFESKSVVVLEVVENQSEPALLGEMATYFIEAGLPGHATELAKIARRYPTDMNALIAVAEIELAREDQPAFANALQSVIAALSAKADRALPWNRRIALATVLTRGQREDLADPQISRCFEQVDEARLRFLTPRSLFRFLALGKHRGLQIDDSRLRALALQLLPPDSREKLR